MPEICSDGDMCEIERYSGKVGSGPRAHRLTKSSRNALRRINHLIRLTALQCLATCQAIELGMTLD